VQEEESQAVKTPPRGVDIDMDAFENITDRLKRQGGQVNMAGRRAGSKARK
jgi:hypothetical protein